MQQQVNTYDSNRNIVSSTTITLPDDVANEGTVATRVDNSLAGLQQWVSNNPNGAVLNAAQTLQLVKTVIGLTKLVRRSFNDTAGT